MSADPRSLAMLLDGCEPQRDWFASIPARARALSLCDADRKAAWAFYIELVSRIATQPLDDEEGVEATALESIAKLFAVGRDIARAAGPEAAGFAAVLLALLNQRLRPFTAPWHKRNAEGRFADPATAGRFRVELAALQVELRSVADLFARMARIPPLASYERAGPP